MASTLQGKSPVRNDTGFSPVPLNCMHTSTADFFRWHVVKAIPMISKDTISFSVDSFVQSAPNPFPINGNMSYCMHAFFVPNRLVWKDWKYYYTELQAGLTPPYFTLGDLWDVFNDSSLSPLIAGNQEYRASAMKFISDIDSLSSLLHFLHLPAKADLGDNWLALKLSAMPLRMVQMLWFDWMRDKMHISDNAKASYCFDTGGHISLQELILLCTPKFRNYSKNIFTAAYDDPHEGLGGVMAGKIATDLNPGLATPSSGAGALGISSESNVGSILSIADFQIPADSNGVISSTSINELRKQSSKQNLAERFEVAGKTIKSRCLALLGTSPTIEELQMSNWLGGREFPLVFNTHQANTSTANGESSYSGQAGAFGYDSRYQNIAGQKGQDIVSEKGTGLRNITYKTDESGYFFVMGCITPNVQYYQGLPKNWTLGLDTFNSDVYDFFHSDFENQPFDPVMFYEICCSEILNPKKIFGFQLMYSHYKQAFDSIAGDFVLNNGNNLLQNMHLGRDVEGLVIELAGGDEDYDSVLTPANLRQSSLYDQGVFDSKFTISDSKLDHFIVNHKISVNMLRPMQLFTLPSLDAELSKVTPKDLLDTGGFSV